MTRIRDAARRLIDAARRLYLSASAARYDAALPTVPAVPDDATPKIRQRVVKRWQRVLSDDAAAAAASPFGVGRLSAARHGQALAALAAARGVVPMVCDDAYPWTGNGATFPTVTGRTPRRDDDAASYVWQWQRADGQTQAASWPVARPYVYPIGRTVTTLDDVSEDDASKIRSAAWRYCRTVDATRSRKRATDSADDVASDALLAYAALLARAGRDWPVVAYADDVDGSEDDWQVAACDALPYAWTAEEAARADLRPVAWTLSPSSADDAVIGDDDDAPRRRVITRATLRRWAIHDAARRNGFRLDVAVSDLDATPDARQMRAADRGVMAMTSDTHVATMTTGSAAAWEAAYDAAESPTLARVLFHASDSDNRGRARGVWHATARDVFGGTGRNPRQESKVRDAAAAEWEALSARLSVIRDATTARVIDV